MEKAKHDTKTIIYHTLSILLIVVSVCFSAFQFSPVAMRVWQALKDLGNSAIFYINGWMEKAYLVDATVRYIPDGMETLLPINAEEFERLMQTFGTLFTDKDNAAAYFQTIGGGIRVMILVVISLTIPLIFLFFVTWWFYCGVDHEHGKKSAAVRILRKLEGTFYYPVKNFIADYLYYLLPDKNATPEKKKASKYLIVLCVVWAWNFNLWTIAIEALAWLLYFSFSLDIANIFVQIAKLGVDLSVAFTSVPTWVLVIAGYLLFNRYRRRIGFKRLNADEEENRDFLKKYPMNVILTGPPRAGKTTADADMAVSRDIIFRKTAKAGSRKRKMQFPHFEWELLEQSIKEMRKRILNFDKEFIIGWIETLEWYFRGRAIIDTFVQEIVLKNLKKVGYKGDDFIFNYDYKRDGLEYDNGLKVVGLFECVEMYALQYAIYTAPTPLIFSNYPIRTQVQYKDKGNYPLMKAELFDISPRKAKEVSQYSHIINHDALRLGKKKNPNGIYNNSYDIGCISISEIGKELGNQKTNQGQKSDSDKCNTQNDLWVTNAKMISHGFTIDDETYGVIMGDEQRSMSILADFRELGSEMKIERRERPVKIKMPFFAWEEALYLISEKLMDKIFDFFNYRHGLKTLCYYLCLKFYSVIYNHYHRVRNTFGSHDIEVNIKEWSDGDEGKTSHEGRKKRKVEIYHISWKKIYSDTFNTVYFGTVYHEKWKRSRVGGLDKTPQFTGLKTTLPQMAYMESHFNETVFKSFGIEAVKPAQQQVRESMTVDEWIDSLSELDLVA